MYREAQHYLIWFRYFSCLFYLVGSSAITTMLQNIISKVSNKDNGKIAGIQKSSKSNWNDNWLTILRFYICLWKQTLILTASIVILIGYLIFKLGYKKYEII